MLRTVIDASALISTELLRTEAAKRMSKLYKIPYAEAYNLAGNSVDEMLSNPQYQKIILGAFIGHTIILARRRMSGLESKTEAQ